MTRTRSSTDPPTDNGYPILDMPASDPSPYTSPSSSPRTPPAVRRVPTPRAGIGAGAASPRRRRGGAAARQRRAIIIRQQEFLLPPSLEPTVPTPAPAPAPVPVPTLAQPPGEFAAASRNVYLAAGSALGLLWDVLITGLRILKRPLIYLLCVYVLAVVVFYVLQTAAQSAYRLLAPICAVPGVSMLELPYCDYYYNSNSGIGHGQGKARTRQGDFPSLINLQSNFEHILENSVGGSSMALDLKNSEVAVRDLGVLVRVSKLINREELSERLEAFVQAAKQASRGLTRFGSRVNGVVDGLLAMDEFALRALENARDAQISSSPSSQPSGSGVGVVGVLLAPFRHATSLAEAENDILSTFLQASNVMDTSIQRLIMEAEIVLRGLDDLENRLATIQDMVSREESVIREQHQEVLAELWTILGGNKRKLANFDSHRTLLGEITGYRSKALAHVSSSLIQLQQMQSDLEDIRDRVIQPSLLADSGNDDIPLEVHIESIRKGVERLTSGRDRAKNKENDYLRKMLSMNGEAIRVLDAGW